MLLPNFYVLPALCSQLLVFSRLCIMNTLLHFLLLLFQLCHSLRNISLGISGKSKVIITVGWVWWRHQRAPFFSLASGPPTLKPPLPTSLLSIRTRATVGIIVASCNNYRGILHLCIAGKVVARLLLPRVRQIADRILSESQCVFHPSRSTSDMVFSLWQLQEKSVEQSRPLYVAFIDLTKAFDTVSRSAFYNILKLLGCPETLLSVLVALHENMKARVQFDGSMSKTFPICRGVKQGCVLAPGPWPGGKGGITFRLPRKMCGT